MNKKDFSNISMNGRLAYQLMCTERYLLKKYSGIDFKPIFKIFWQATNGMYWDTFSNYIIDFEPNKFLEFDTYEEQEWLILTKDLYNQTKPIISTLGDDVNDLFETLKEQTFVYAYSIIPKNTIESINIIFDTIGLLKKEKIDLPDIKLVEFSTIDQRNGWGNHFDGTNLSLILTE